MSQINISKISPEVNEKYSVVSNSFRLVKVKNAELDKYTNTPKDLITAEVGDVKQQDFYPQLKLARWGNNEEVGEVNFSVRLKDDDGKNAQITTDKDKIVWDKGNTQIEFYESTEGEGGYKMVWYLKEKPLINKIEFTMQSKGLDFFYQPELTAEEIAEGAERPENVVGSYAVYHSTKGGMVDSYGKDYKVGKAFHIYRPHIIDANGAETWGILHIENGIYSVEIPQEFLDTAVYPIKSNDTFGDSSAGATVANAADDFHGSAFTAPANVGTVTSISFYVNDSFGDAGAKAVIIVTSTLNITTNGVAPDKRISTLGWYTSTYSSTPTVSASVSYVLGVVFQYIDTNFYYDTTGGASHIDTTNSYTTPQNLGSSTTGTRSYSIYATYTPGGGGGVTGRRIAHGFIHTGNFAVA